MKKICAWIVKYLTLIIFAILILFPVYVVAVGSFKSEFEMYNNIFGLPESWGLENYITAFESGQMAVYFKNSLFVTALSVMLLILLSSMTAFALSRLHLRGRSWIYKLFVIGIAVPTQVGIIQLALLMSKLQLTNSLLGLVLVYVAYELPFSVFVFYGYMQSLPWEIQEAAIVDGCNLWRLYWQVAMPLSKNAIATVLIFDMVTVWNDMLFPLMLISKEKLRTLPFGLLQFRGQYSSQYTVIFAGVILITIPLIVLYLTMQKQFVSGMTQGAVKG